MIFKTKQWKFVKLCKLKKTIHKYYRVKENNGKLVSCEMKIYAQVCLNNYVYTEWTCIQNDVSISVIRARSRSAVKGSLEGVS